MTVLASLTPETRARLRRIVTPAWLILLSAAVVVDHVSLSHLTREAQGTAQSTEVHALKGNLSSVEQQLATIERQPNGVSHADFTAARTALDERLGKVEQALGGSAHMNDLLPLQTRLEQVEARLEKSQQTSLPTSALARRRGTQTATPKVIEPRFALLGIERRGDETFLSIAPTGTQSLPQVRLLHAGDTQDNWRLEALEGKTATFRVDGQTRQITVP